MNKLIISINAISTNGDYDVVLHGEHCEHHRICRNEEAVIAHVADFLGMQDAAKAQHTPTGNEQLAINQLRATKGEVKR